MKYLLFLFLGCSFTVQSQIDYTVTVTKLKALADDCDGEIDLGLIVVCPFAPQDPVFKLWVLDENNTNENYYCWTFDSDENQAYGLWNDIQNVEIANETNVASDYLIFDAAGFESDDAIVTCSSSLLDEAVYDRQFVDQINFNDLQSGVPYTHVLSLDGVYFFEIEIVLDNHAVVTKLEQTFFTLAPNPTSGSFRIKLDNAEAVGFSAVVRDMMGRIIYTQETTSSVAEVDISAQEAGVYFITINAGNKNATKRIMLK